jgi:hypothetical protein
MDEIPSLCLMLRRWVCTVSDEMYSSAAISGELLPTATMCNMLRSRLLSVAKAAEFFCGAKSYFPAVGARL